MIDITSGVAPRTSFLKETQLYPALYPIGASRTVVAEWLRRLTRNQLPSGSAGSNPANCEYFFFFATFVTLLLNLSFVTFMTFKQHLFFILTKRYAGDVSLSLTWSKIFYAEIPKGK